MDTLLNVKWNLQQLHEIHFFIYVYYCMLKFNVDNKITKSVNSFYGDAAFLWSFCARHQNIFSIQTQYSLVDILCSFWSPTLV